MSGMKPQTAKLSELVIATSVAAVSHKFGLPPTRDDRQTATGGPLADNPDEQAAKQWFDDVCDKFTWMFKSNARVKREALDSVVALIVAAFNGDEKAAAQLRADYYGRPRHADVLLNIKQDRD